MPSSRLIIDRLLRLITPTLDVSFAPGPAELREGLWAVDRRLRILGSVVPCRSVVPRLANGELVILGAPALASRCAAELAALGRVAAVVAPNCFHYLYAAETLAQFSTAKLVVAPGLPDRVPTLPPALALDGRVPPPWTPELEHVVFGPVRGVAEVIFYHAPSRTVVLTDLASNLVSHPRPIDAWISRAYGMPSAFGPSRNARMLLRVDRDVTRHALRRVLEWPFEAIVVAHGEAVEQDARRRFTEAFAAFL